MIWLSCFCILLCLLLLALIFKVAALHRGTDEIRQELLSWFDSDTNTVLTLSCRDRHIAPATP